MDNMINIKTSGFKCDRSGWKTVRLGDILDYEQPQPYIVTNDEYVESGIPVLTPGKSHILGYTSETVGIYMASQHPCILFDDFLTITRYVDYDFKVKSSAVKMLSIKSGCKANLRFIYAQMKQKEKIAEEHQRHWITQTSKEEIRLPDLKTQDSIAKAIASIDEQIMLTQHLISKYESIKKATVNLLLKPKVGWKQVKLGDIGEVAMCKRILKSQTSTTGDVPFYKIGTFGKCPDAFITHDLFEDYKRRFSYPKVGDVLLSAAGTIGRTVVFNGDDAYFQDSNIVWIVNDESIVTNPFLNAIYSQVEWQTENGGTVSRLYNANILNTMVFIPQLNEQKDIVASLDSINNSINGLSALLEKTQNLKQSMLQYFFGD